MQHNIDNKLWKNWEKEQTDVVWINTDTICLLRHKTKTYNKNKHQTNKISRIHGYNNNIYNIKRISQKQQAAKQIHSIFYQNPLGQQYRDTK